MSWRRRHHLEMAQPPRLQPAVSRGRAPAYLSPGPRAERWPTNSLWRRKLNRHILKPAAEPQPYYHWPTNYLIRYETCSGSATTSGSAYQRGWDYDLTGATTHSNSTKYA